MRIDYEYLNKILKIFLDSESLTVNFNSFDSLANENEEKFIFHIILIADGGLISDVSGNSSIKSLGIFHHINNYTISIIPWRLTLLGHDFASSLTKPTILETIKEKFKEDGLSAVIDIAKELVNKQAEKLLE